MILLDDSEWFLGICASIHLPSNVWVESSGVYIYTASKVWVILSEYQYTFIQHTVCILYRVYIYTTPVIAWAPRWNLGITPKPFTEDKYNRDKVTIQYSVNTIQCNTYNTTVTEWIQFTRGTKRPSTASPWPRCVWSDGGVKEGSVWPIYKNIHYTVGSSLANIQKYTLYSWVQFGQVPLLL